MSVAVLIPTVPDRERYLARAVQSVAAEADVVLIVKGFSSCGAAWQSGITSLLATPGWEYLMLYADDLEAKPGWSACRTMLPETMPGAWLLNDDGSRWDNGGNDPDDGTLTTFQRVPFMTREQANYLVQPPGFPPLHYYSDALVSHRLGRPVRMEKTFAHVHYWAQEHRIHSDGADRTLWINEERKVPPQPYL